MSGHASGDRLAVLAFHSISPDRGPTSIPPGTFRMQLDALGRVTRDGEPISDEMVVAGDHLVVAHNYASRAGSVAVRNSNDSGGAGKPRLP